MNYGYIPDAHKEEDYTFLGSTGIADYGAPLAPNGQWDAFLPPDELQRKYNVETQSCVTFALLNAIETLLKRKFGAAPDYSERFTAVVSGTTRQGNTPRTVCDAIRDCGLVPERLLPFDASIKTFDDFMTPRPMTTFFLIEGARWLSNWTLNYEQVIPATPDLMHALSYSPLAVSVRAWWEEDGLYTSKPDEEHNHLTLLYGYELGKYWKVFDTYDRTHKKLAWNYPFKQVVRLHIERNPRQGNWFAEIIRNILKLFV